MLRLGLRLSQTTRICLRTIPVHRLCSATAEGKNNITLNAIPPFPVRVLVVGSTVGIATPVFATAGIIVGWYRFLPTQRIGRAFKIAVGLVLGGGVASLTYSIVFPFLQSRSDFVLPFALANAVTAGFWYAVIEKAIGLNHMVETHNLSKLLPDALLKRGLVPEILLNIHLPVGALGVGVLTVATAHLLWPPLVHMVWNDELKLLVLGSASSSSTDAAFLVDLWSTLLLPVGVPVAIGAGLGLHYMLAPFLSGRLGGTSKTWKQTCGPLLACVGGLSVTYFSLCRVPSSDYYWQERMDVKTGELISFNIRTNESRNGLAAVNEGAWARHIAQVALVLRRPLGAFRDLITNNSTDETRISTQPISLQPNLVTLQNIDEHASVSLLLDMLVRLKYLQLMQQTQGVDLSHNINMLCKQARQRFGVKLAPLLEDMQSIVVLANDVQMQRSLGGESEQVNAALQALIQANKHALTHASSTENVEMCHNLLRSVAVNNSVFARALQEELSFAIPESYRSRFFKLLQSEEVHNQRQAAAAQTSKALQALKNVRDICVSVAVISVVAWLGFQSNVD